MKPGDCISVCNGWVTFGADLALRAELVQAVEVAPAAAANIPAVATGATEPASGWAQLEVKYQPKSAPYVVFVGSEKACRCKARKLLQDLRRAQARPARTLQEELGDWGLSS